VKQVAGERIADRYTVEAVLGTGGMAAVYRVRDEHTGRYVALKRLQNCEAHKLESRRALFEREYHALAELAHPRIIEVYDYGVEAAGAYYTMELLDGRDLRERGRLPWRDACAILRDVASSLAILHSRRLLHRDVTPRNVRCTADGRAKLLDFGAMCGMGVQKKPVGTPPFVPPEALQQLALDGRADLYALGGVAYWVLTGAYPYIARRLTELPEAWKRPPAPPRARVREIPEALEALVVELLSLDRTRRPSSAAEVMDRLCDIAELAPEEHPSVGQAYLVAPSLVGRDALVARARALLERVAHGGAPGVLRIEGAAGRSRLLEECVLEAKLAGLVVLRADASDASRGAYGAARALAVALLEALPALARVAARAHASSLAAVVPELGQPAPAQPVSRRHVQIALCDWLTTVARQRPLALALDDFEAIDEPSAAVIANLANGSRARGLCVVAALPPEASSPAVELLRDVGERLELAPLAPEQAHELLGSIFGAADGLSTVADHLHRLSGGSPRALVELARHLVDRGAARYAAGSWTLDLSALPESLPAVRAARLDELTVAGRDLAEVLALGDPARHPVAEITALVGGNGARSFRSIDELVRAGLLHVAGDRFLFTHPCWSRLLAEKLHGERRRSLNARLAGVLERHGDRYTTARHWLEAGREQRAIELLHALALERDGAPAREAPPGAVALFERAVAAADRLGLSQQVQLDLRLALVDLGCRAGAHTQIRRHLGWLGERLRHDSGLGDWHELVEEQPGQRLKLALVRAQKRWQDAAASGRGPSPADALRQLGRVCAIAVASASTASDLALLEELPPLEPVAALSPSLALVAKIVAAAKDALGGRESASRAGFRVALALFEGPDRAGLEPWLLEAAPRLLHGALGVADALRACSDALGHAAALHALPEHRAHAWRVRAAYERMLGDTERAREYGLRAERCALREGQLAREPSPGQCVELAALVLSEDREAMRQLIPRLQAQARLLPRTSGALELLRAESLRLAGNAEAALEGLERALQAALPGRSRLWTLLAAARVRALAQRMHDAEAAERGLADLEQCRVHGLDPAPLYPPLLEALAWLGRLEQAEALHCEARAELDEKGVEGVARALLDEAGARIAFLRAEPSAFRASALRFADHCRRTGNAALRERLERLLRDAERSGIEVAPELARSVRAPAHAASRTGEADLARLLARAGEHAGARDALLCVPRAGQIAPVAPADVDLDPELATALESLFRTVRADRSSSRADVELGGVRIELCALTAECDGDAAVVGALVLESGETPRELPEAALREIAAALLAGADLDPLRCLD
jgi:hypothetical protein